MNISEKKDHKGHVHTLNMCRESRIWSSIEIKENIADTLKSNKITNCYKLIS